MRHYDYIIAGSGLAGLYTAYLAAAYGKVALITKCGITESNSYLPKAVLQRLQTKTTPRLCISKIRLLPAEACAIIPPSIFWSMRDRNGYRT